MPLLLKIYLSCVVGGCIFIMLMNKWKKGQSKRSYDEFNEVSLGFHLGLAVIPLLNILASLFALIIIWAIICDTWSNIGLNITIRLTKRHRYFRIKELLVRILFRQHIDIFYKLITTDLLGRIKKALKNEKAKHQSESETHPQPAGENQKVLTERKGNNPA